jgi:hypothetical protein
MRVCKSPGSTFLKTPNVYVYVSDPERKKLSGEVKAGNKFQIAKTLFKVGYQIDRFFSFIVVVIRFV